MSKKVNWEKIQRKISCLRAEYAKKKPGITGSSPSKWQFYESVHKILHGSHYFNPENITTFEAGVEEDNVEEIVVVLDPEESDTVDVLNILEDSPSTNHIAVPISQSSRAAKERKKRRIASTGIQEDVFEFLKKSKQEDSLMMERMVKSQEDTNTLLSKMVENMSQLVKVA
ncbi:unnamed protein product, partial [Allacma fusca]